VVLLTHLEERVPIDPDITTALGAIQSDRESEDPVVD
jgi:hypothetical protein